MLLTIDGCDGSGKGQQIDFIKAWFKNNNLKLEVFRDPGDTPLGESIRQILLERKDLAICTKSELALFMASRAQLIAEKIKPTLQAGVNVLLDRYILSTVVYQGYATRATSSEIDVIWKTIIDFTDKTLPDLTIVLDCPAEVAARRLCREKDRIESKSIEFRNSVSDGYRLAAEAWKKYSSGQIFVLDATKTPESIFDEIKKILAQTLF